MRVLTGIQASGKLHIGNYFGAMKPMIELQEENELFTFIANYHSLTTSKDADENLIKEGHEKQQIFTFSPTNNLNEKIHHLYIHNDFL